VTSGVDYRRNKNSRIKIVRILALGGVVFRSTSLKRLIEGGQLGQRLLTPLSKESDFLLCRF